jgi:hypothetical protein
LALILVLGCGSAAAEQSLEHRGWLTGAGLLLAGAGAVVTSVGVYSAAEGESAARALRAYYANGAAPTAAEAGTVHWLHERSERLSASALLLLVGGGAAVVVGISVVFFDGWLGGTSVSLSIEPGPASVRVSGTF